MISQLPGGELIAFEIGCQLASTIDYQGMQRVCYEDRIGTAWIWWFRIERSRVLLFVDQYAAVRSPPASRWAPRISAK